MKYALIKLATSLAIMLSAQLAVAQTPPAPAAAGESAKTTSEMADGEVRKVDKETKKITLRHGVIKSLDMPAMTMVFGVKDAAMLDYLKAGDKIKFKAEQAGSAITVTEIQPIK
jgi:Cu(I)/Ag(I) efflux system periplasmic protein CusF